MMYDFIVKLDDNVVNFGDNYFIDVDCSAFKAGDPNAVIIAKKGNNVWVERSPFNGRETDFDQTIYQSIIDEANLKLELEQPPAQPTLEQAKDLRIRLINNEYHRTLSLYIKDYPSIETKTWPIQETEARGFLNDPTYSTPMLDKILEGRNGTDGTETLSQLAQAVVTHSDEFKTIQTFTGYRQRLEKAIKNATTVSEVDSVVWEL